MSVVTKRTVTTTRHEYILRSPTSTTELWKAEDWAQSDLRAAGIGGDYMVEARDHEVVIWWEEPTAAAAPFAVIPDRVRSTPPSTPAPERPADQIGGDR